MTIEQDGLTVDISNAGEGAAQPEVTAADTPVEQVEQTGEHAATGAEQQPGEQKQDQTPPWAKREITIARNRQRDAEDRARRAELFAETLARQIPQQQQTQEVVREPVREKYATDQEFATAVIQHHVQLGVQTELAAREKQRAAAEAQVRFNESVAQAKGKFEDFDEVVYASRAPISKPVEVAIKDSPVSGEIFYWLAKNPDDAARISALPEIAAARVIGRIEAMLIASSEAGKAAPRAAPMQQAPKPITPVTGANPVAKDPYQMTAEEFYKYDQQQDAIRRAQQRTQRR